MPASVVIFIVILFLTITIMTNMTVVLCSDVQYYVIQYKPKAATWDYKEISGAITNFYDIRGLR